MTILSIILGIVLAVCGVALMFTPLITFLGAGYFLAILLLVFGAVGVIGGIVRKNYGVRFLSSIIAAVLGLVILIVPGLAIGLDAVVVYLMAFWFLIMGISSIYSSVRTKSAMDKTKTKNKTSKAWIWGIVLGILEIVLAVYSFAHPTLLALTIGILIGLYFVIMGVSMIAMPAETEE